VEKVIEYLKVSENPKRFCSDCNREVYQTVHRTGGYYCDWYSKGSKIFCVNCYENTVVFKHTS